MRHEVVAAQWIEALVRRRRHCQEEAAALVHFRCDLDLAAHLLSDELAEAQA